ncbi:1590_t:CDS:2 [Scutellospora calospora]|uniref:1590_t:CDS:1 n=1 Tax=Scutellospora calospora TaxID=85575 RepID=A0ACA9K2Y5_9GLOM|nr:1590_t:CDS:2 [Scutellospora calospora]
MRKSDCLINPLLQTEPEDSNSYERDITIPETSPQSLTPCVVIDIIQDVEAVKDAEKKCGHIAKKSNSGYRARYICTECFQQHGGHLYEKLGKRIAPPSSESEDQELQETLLSQISLTIFSDKRFHITQEKALTMGKRLGNEILYLRSKIKKNVSQLENPSSYDDYINALPNIIFSFFKALLTVLQQYKLTVVNNKRRQRNLADQETMMMKIKAAQSEKNRLAMLLAEYVDDIVVSQSVRAVKSRKDSLWSLATKLLSAFDDPNLATHFLFKDAPEISKNGIENILSFYETGTSRFQQVLVQDVYKTEAPISGCRSRNINAYTYAKLVSMKKQKISQVNYSIQVQEDASTSYQTLLPSEINLSRQTRHATTKAEKDILVELFKVGEGMPEAAIITVMLKLQTISSDWTKERVKQYYKNNWRKYVQK